MGTQKDNKDDLTMLWNILNSSCFQVWFKGDYLGGNERMGLGKSL